MFTIKELKTLKSSQYYIFKLEIPKDWSYSNFEASYVHISHEIPKFFHRQFGAVCYHLSPILMDWFECRNAPYGFDYDIENRHWYVEIFDDETAMLFKLAYV